MKQRLLELLACPSCQNSLDIETVTEREGENIVEAHLRCEGCSAGYPVRNGIPRFLATTRSDDARLGGTANHFTKEFTAFEDDEDLDPAELIEHYFVTRTGVDLDVLDRSSDAFPTELPAKAARRKPDYGLIEGKVVLDAGCGTGRFTRIVSEHADLAVGLDIGGHIERAQRSSRHLANVEFVQGSVLRPPFRSETFDFVFSVGVLHHTPDPEAGCRALAALVRRGGHLSVWVYGPGYWGGTIRRITGRLIHALVSTLPPGAGWTFCARALYPLGRLQMLLARRRWTKLVFAPLFVVSIPRHPRREVMITTIYDYYGPKIISTHTYDEARRWFETDGFSELKPIPVPTGWLGKKV